MEYPMNKMGPNNYYNDLPMGYNTKNNYNPSNSQINYLGNGLFYFYS